MEIRALHRGGNGALLISLDIELHWGIRDYQPLDAVERNRLLSARRVVPRILSLFEEFDIHATWAVVGFLFASSKQELERFSPPVQPRYKHRELNPYLEATGQTEADDPFHFAPSLIRMIARHNAQEIGTHSFSHFCCMEEGQTIEAFESDLRSAIAIASESGHKVLSYAFARNQSDTPYIAVLEQAGLLTYRGAEPGGFYQPVCFQSQRRWYKRLPRLIDSYANLSGAKGHAWPSQDRLVSLPASRYLAPYRPYLEAFEGLRRNRILSAMENAAKERKIFHLWWHPEDFAYNCDRNLTFLREILTGFARLRAEFGMQSVCMSEAGMAAVQAAQAVEDVR